MSNRTPRPHFMPIKLRTGHYARSVGPLTLPQARAVSVVAQAAPEMLDLLRDAEQFIAGFESDELQDPPVDMLLARMRLLIAKIEGPRA